MKKFDYYVQRQEPPIECGGQNMELEAMGELGWELCGIHDGMYIYKREIPTK